LRTGLASALCLQHICRYIVQCKTILFLLMAGHTEATQAAGRAYVLRTTYSRVCMGVFV